MSDVHLGHRPADDVAADLARLVTSHAGHEIVLNGDTFNLSCDARAVDPGVSVAAMLVAHPPLVAALKAHAAGGHPVTFVAGNHDTDVQGPRVAAALADVLGRGSALVRVEPWFIRRGDVHIEHGQMYDQDNAPAHPLAPPSFRSEPLGVALSRRFLGPYQAYALGERYDRTSAENMRLIFKLFGARAPLVLLHYVAILAAITRDAAAPGRLEPERAAGEAAVEPFAERVGVPATTVRALLETRPLPTHASAARTFGRFDFDGALATLAVPVGIGAAVAAWPATGAVTAAAGLSYLAASRRYRARRRANHMPADLRAGAALVRRVTGARTVIFGHTHTEDAAEGYVNLGAFGDPPHGSRTFVHVDTDGRVHQASGVRSCVSTCWADVISILQSAHAESTRPDSHADCRIEITSVEHVETQDLTPLAVRSAP